jgi:hypothetical protein
MSNQHIIPPPIEIDPIPEELRRQRREARMERRRRHIRTRAILWSTIGGSVLLLGLMGFIYLQIQSIITHNTAYPVTNGVACNSGEQSAFHMHVRLSIYINGKQYTVPKGVGIAPDNSCFYWMHTHTSDGIIHIEAPANYNLSLDDFLNIWYKVFPKLSPPPQFNQTGWKIYQNGKLRTDLVADPLQIEMPLTSHNFITMDFGTNNPPPDKFYTFPANLPT